MIDVSDVVHLQSGVYASTSDLEVVTNSRTPRKLFAANLSALHHRWDERVVGHDRFFWNPDPLAFPNRGCLRNNTAVIGHS